VEVQKEKNQKEVRNTQTNWFYLSIFACAAIAFGIGIVWSWNETLVYENTTATISYTYPAKLTFPVFRRSKIERIPFGEAKGLYLTAYSAGSTKKLDSIIDLIDRTELNAVVIDVKDYSGLVLYDSDVDLVNELDLEDNRLRDVKAIVDRLHSHNIYVIARQTVFQDPILAEKKPEWAMKSKSGGLWRDYKGLAWVDPAKEEIWNYNIQIAHEVASFGFDEINFDYVRFPTDGNMSQIAYTNGDEPFYSVMRNFYTYLDDRLKNDSVFTSLDFFGFVMERHDGMSIGQRLEDAVDKVDYISPMMYPSHYPRGHLRLDNPSDFPAIVIENGMQKGAPYFEGKRAQVRPWIQAFNLGAVYDAEKIRAQIDMVEKYTDAGWLLWNASNRYSADGLKEK